MPKPGVVHEDVDGADARFDRRELRGVGEIGGEHLGVRAAAALDLLGERFEARRVACDEHDVVARAPTSWRANCSPIPTDAPVINATGLLMAASAYRRSTAIDCGMSATSVPLTTMRSAALCFGWHAMSVTVGVGVGSVT